MVFRPSGDNPANLLTRGISVQKLFSSEWWFHGPVWLLSQQDWPQWIPTNANTLVQTSEGETDYENTMTLTQDNEKNDIDIRNFVDIKRYIYFSKLLA